jgi:hypothetical protein
MSTTFAQLAAAPGVAIPDPSKHVNYTLGMLLGVDDFKQEFAYLAGRDQWMARDLVGYGTICGLRVSLDVPAQGPRITVTAGTGLSPKGQMMCVRSAQCALLNDWITANEAAVAGQLGSPLSGMLSLWLVLCYRDCVVDPVPIAGEPCRSVDDLMAPSRLVDDFRLELRLAPPDQQEEDAVRLFVSFMDQVTITDDPGDFPTLSEFIDALRSVLLPAASPLDPGFFQFGSPLSKIHVRPVDGPEFMRAAFRIWVTEIRPFFHTSWPDQLCSCTGTMSSTTAASPEECLLLAEVNIPVVNAGPGDNWLADDKNPAVIDERRRPILLHSRLMQEWIQGGLVTGK